MTAPATPPPPPPVYTGIVDRALDATNFGQLQAAAYQAVNGLYADPNTPAAVVKWIAENAGNKTTIDATLQRFLCFVVVDPALIAFNGDLAQADLATLSKALLALVGNFVASISRAQAAV
jgi:hypothetical protein